VKLHPKVVAEAADDGRTEGIVKRLQISRQFRVSVAAEDDDSVHMSSCISLQPSPYRDG
jgi:hypothetical protein